MRSRDLDEAYGEAVSRCASLEASSQRAEDMCARLRRRVRTLQLQHESLASELSTRVAQVEEECAKCHVRLSEAKQRETKYEDNIASQQRQLRLQGAQTEIMRRRLDDALAAAAASHGAIAAADVERRRSAELTAALARKEGLMAKQARRAAAAVEIQNALIACKRRLTQRESQIKECRAVIARERASNRDMTERCIQVAEDCAAADCAREDAEQSAAKAVRELKVLRANAERSRQETILQREEIRRLRADVAAVSSLGMEESMLFAGGHNSRDSTVHRQGIDGNDPRSSSSSSSSVPASSYASVSPTVLHEMLDGERVKNKELRAALTDLAEKFALSRAGVPPVFGENKTHRLAAAPSGDGTRPDAAPSLLLGSMLNGVVLMTGEVNSLTRVLGQALSGDADFDAEDLFGDGAREHGERAGADAGKEGTGDESVLAPASVAKLCKQVDSVRERVREARQSLNDALARSLGGGCEFQ